MATNLRANAATEAAADGAIYQAILRLLQGTWAPDGRLRVIRVGDAAVEVRISNQSRKVNPNTATLAGTAGAAGQSRPGCRQGRGAGTRDRRLALEQRAIAVWRTKTIAVSGGWPAIRPGNQLFDSLDDIGLVVGMTPALLARMKPFLSIYREGDRHRRMICPPHRRSVGRRRRSAGILARPGRVMVVMIDATAAGAKGGRFTRQAVVRLRAEASLDQSPYQILTWGTPSA